MFRKKKEGKPRAVNRLNREIHKMPKKSFNFGLFVCLKEKKICGEIESICYSFLNMMNADIF